MTKEEAKKILEAYIACESKKAHFECGDYNCDNDCPLLYEMGTVGEYNEAINVAIQALKQETTVIGTGDGAYYNIKACEDAVSNERSGKDNGC